MIANIYPPTFALIYESPNMRFVIGNQSVVVGGSERRNWFMDIWLFQGLDENTSVWIGILITDENGSQEEEEEEKEQKDDYDEDV